MTSAESGWREKQTWGTERRLESELLTVRRADLASLPGLQPPHPQTGPQSVFTS